MRLALLGTLILAGCSTTGIPPSSDLSTENANYRAVIASYVGHFPDAKPKREYEISEPWTALTGEFMFCISARVNGNPARENSMVAMEHGKVTIFVKPFACGPEHTFTPLEPVKAG